MSLTRNGQVFDRIPRDDPDFVANTADRHSQGTDLGLDTGGTNPVTAATVKGHIDIISGNPHGTDYADVGAEPANANIQTHIGTVSGNPHAVTKTEVGLGSVTDDAQLKRAAADFASFTEKTGPVAADLVLIEDSASAGAKKKVSRGNLFDKVFAAMFPEFAGAVLAADGSSNSLLITGEHDATNRRNHYRGTTAQATTQDRDIVVQARLPETFTAWDSAQAIRWYDRVSVTPGATGIELRVYDTAGTLRHTTAKAQDTSWTAKDITAADLAAGTWTAGGTITLAFRLYADQAKNADLGEFLLKQA